MSDKKAKFVPNQQDPVVTVSPGDSGPFLQVLKAKGYQVFTLDGAQIRSREELLQHLAAKMKFPEYFSKNWDALEECLRDLEWLPAKGYVIQIANGEQFIASAPSEYSFFARIVHDVADYWERRNIGFVLLVEKSI